MPTTPSDDVRTDRFGTDTLDAFEVTDTPHPSRPTLNAATLTGKWWSGDDGKLHIVGTRSKDGVDYGVLVNAETGAVGAEVPAASIASMMPYTNFTAGKGPPPASVTAPLETADVVVADLDD